MTTLALDRTRSVIRIRTFAAGLFARLAHDLELVCKDLSGSAERAADGSAAATVEIPVARIEVAGTLRSGRVDPDGLSAGDRADCLARMRGDVFHAGAHDDVVRASATLADGRGSVRVVPPNGRVLSRPLDVRVRTEGDDVHVSGRAELSLDALGADPVKGPMNAFRVKDTVEVLFELVFAPG